MSLESLHELGNHCYHKEDYKKAIQHYLLSVRVDNNADSLLQLWKCYYMEEDHKKAIKYLRTSVKRGNSDAQTYLGDYYYHGMGVPKNYKKAVKYYELSAKQGNPIAQNSLGDCYYDGFGVPQDHKKAIEYYILSAEQGNADAQNNLGSHYMNKKNIDEAFKYFKLSAEQGHQKGQKNLGTLYFHRLEDYQKAHELYTLCEFNLGIDECEIMLIKTFKWHTDNYAYMYPIFVKHKSDLVHLLHKILLRRYTKTLKFLPNVLANIVISYLL